MNKKIIRVSVEIFLLEAHNDRIATTSRMDEALDVSEWDFNKVSYVMGNLTNVGYKPKIIEVKK